MGKDTHANTGEHDRTIHARRRLGLVWNLLCPLVDVSCCCWCLQAMARCRLAVVPSDTSSQFFYQIPVEDDCFCLEWTLCPGYFVCVEHGQVFLKKTTTDDDQAHFIQLCPRCQSAFPARLHSDGESQRSCRSPLCRTPWPGRADDNLGTRQTELPRRGSGHLE